MAISTYIVNGNKEYEVFVKVRNTLGKQVAKRKRGIGSFRKAKELGLPQKK
ncbi:MAG: hypothetical protein H6625_00365 [Bdellovibrionaceae bacterium]|nr:hypothetical protein [Pseudobdellovibrionaceae bacterium]